MGFSNIVIQFFNISQKPFPLRLTMSKVMMKTIEELCLFYGFKPITRYESSHSGTVLRTVELGMGVGIEPVSTLHGQSFRVKAIELVDAPQKVEIKMMWLKARTDELKGFFNILNHNLI